MIRSAIVLSLVLLFGATVLAEVPQGTHTGGFDLSNRSEKKSTLKVDLLTGGSMNRGFSRKDQSNSRESYSSGPVFGLRTSGIKSAEASGGIGYDADLSLLVADVSGGKDDSSNQVASSKKKQTRQAILVLPGNNLNAEIKIGEGIALGAGRFYTSREMDSVSFGHGPITGAHLRFESEYGKLEIIPYYIPSLSGSSFDDTGLPIINPGWDLTSKTGRLENHGSQIRAAATFKYFLASVHYSVNRQETAIEDETARDQVHYTGGALEIRKPDGWLRAFLRTGAERSQGNYLTVDRDEKGSKVARIEGLALFSSFMIGSESISFNGNVFIPEPATKAHGTRKSSEKSGYVGYGDSIISTRSLGAAALPFPTLCDQSGSCTGLEKSTAYPGFRSHAATATVSLSGQIHRFYPELSGSIMKPLAEREDQSANPFVRLKPSDKVPQLRELTFSLSYRLSGSTIAGAYSRIWAKTNRAVAAEESLRIRFQTDLF